MRSLHSSSVVRSRSGVVLLVVLAMLTLFATVAIAFVSLSENVAVNMTLNKAAQNLNRPDPDLLCSYALTQLVFEGDNPNSSLWTHSFVRDLYGSGNQPFSGVGRLKFNVLAGPPTDPTYANAGREPELEPATGPDYPFVVSDFIHMKGRNNPVTTLNGRRVLNEALYGTLNSPYTYPDHDHAFLGAFGGNAVVTHRSFVRSPQAAGITSPYSSDASTYFGWWTDTDPFMVNPGVTGLIQLALNGGGAPEWNNLRNELRRRRAMVLRPRPGLPSTFVVPGVPPPPGPPGPSTHLDVMIAGLSALPGGIDAGLINPFFPVPDDLGGDVKNLPNLFQTFVHTPPAPPVFAQNDSYWIDLDFPIQTDPASGRRYKPLFAFFIADLDGMANVNFHGNSIPTGPGVANRHASNQGWGPWEVNLARVVYPSYNATPLATEYPLLYNQRLVSGTPGTPMGYELGKWGQNGAAGNGVNPAPGFNSVLHYYGQVDYSARDAAGQPIAAASIVNSAATTPLFPTTYRNTVGELAGHYVLHQTPAFVGDDRFFGAENLEALYRHGDSGTYGLHSDLRRLLPYSFREPNASTGRSARYMVTTHSFDLVRAGLSPYLAQVDPDNPPTFAAGGGAEIAGGYPANAWSGAGSNSRIVAQPAYGVNLPFPFTPSIETSNVAGRPWRAQNWLQPNNEVWAKVNLNRYLRPYPHQGTFNLNAAQVDNNYGPGVLPVAAVSPPFTQPAGVGQVMPAQPSPAPTPATLAAPANEPVRFDRHPTYVFMHQLAEADRQALARDVYKRLISLSGATIPAVPAAGLNDATFNQQLRVLRMLGQLAVNIVDYLDEDDICTPFLFYSEADVVLGGTGLPEQALYSRNDMVNPGEADQERLVRRFWVYGTEMPRIVVNEVLAEYTPAAVDGAPTTVKLWAELASTLPQTLPANNPNATDARAEPLWVPATGGNPGYAPYQLVVAGTNNTADGPLAATANDNFNATGVWHNEPMSTQNFRCKTQNADFQNPVGYVPQNPTPAAATFYSPARVVPGQAWLIGPPNGSNPDDPPDFRRSIQSFANAIDANTGFCPSNTPFIRSANLQYTPNWNNNPAQWQFGGQNINDGVANTGVTVLLRRLANPYMPPQSNIAQPNYNPYVTIDYLSHVRLNSTNTATYRSTGKVQPFASGRRQHLPQEPIWNGADPTAGVQTTRHTLGSLNWPTPAGPAPQPASYSNSPETPLYAGQPPYYDSLVHLDRRVANPIELLGVSAYKPHELTQRFMTDVTIAGSGVSPGPATAGTAIVANPAATQIVQIQSADPAIAVPAIRPGMVLRVGGIDPTGGGTDPAAVCEYVTVLGVDPAASPPTFTAVFTSNHPVNTVISIPHGHRAPWLDESRRLIRALEYLDGANRFQSKIGFGAQAAPAGTPSPWPGLEVRAFAVRGNELQNVNGDSFPLDLEPGALVEVRNPLTGIIAFGQVWNVTNLSAGSVELLMPVGFAYTPAPNLPELYVTPHGGRVPGKINLNAVRNPEVFKALCDAQLGNSFNPPIAAAPALAVNATTVTVNLPFIDPSNPTVPMGVTNGVAWSIQVGTYLEFRHPTSGPETVQVTAVNAGAINPGPPVTRQFTIQFTPLTQAQVQPAHRTPYPAGTPITIDYVTAIYAQLLQSRDGVPAMGIAPRPFQGFTRGPRAALSLPFDFNPMDESYQTPYGAGIVDSVFRPEPTLMTSPTRTLFEVPAAHPAKSHELLAKIAGNVTSRSNVFAVWMTVGYFEVDGAGNLGSEIGRQSGRHVRHRFFSIVDRSVLDNWVRLQGPNYSVRDGIGNVNYLLGNSSIDPRKDKLMLDVTATVLPGPPPAPYNDGLTQQVQLPGPIAAAGISFGTRVAINEGRPDAELATVINGNGANIIYIRFNNPAGPPSTRAAGAIRITSRLPRSVIHWSQIE